MKSGMFLEKRALSFVEAIGAFILILIVFIILLLFVFPAFGGHLDILSIVGVNSNNIQPITAECELACSDRDSDKFCVNLTSKPLRLGDGRSVKGSCEALSDLGAIGLFDGIKKCSRFSCGEVEEAVCSKGIKKSDCKTWMTEAEQKKLEAEELEEERIIEEQKRWAEA